MIESSLFDSWTWRRLPWRRVWARHSMSLLDINWTQSGTSWYGTETRGIEQGHDIMLSAELKDKATGV